MGLTVKTERQYGPSRGDGFTVIADQEVKLSSKGDSELPIPLRRIEILRDEGAKTIIVITNDMTHSAVEIAQAYKPLANRVAVPLAQAAPEAAHLPRTVQTPSNCSSTRR